MEYELLTRGRHIDELGSSLSWRDLALLLWSPQEGGPLHRAAYGAESPWNLQARILAGLFDAVMLGNWQRQGAAQAPKPDPWPRPGVDGFTQTIGAADDDDAYDIDELANLYGKPLD